MAMISAWAVGSKADSLRLWPRAMILLSDTITAPMGTSPFLRAFLASLSASFMKRVCLSDSFFFPLITNSLISVLFGAPGGSRTPDPQIRSLMLYPAELRAQLFLVQFEYF